MSKYTAFRCPVDLLCKARRIADSEHRSLSNYIIRLLEEDSIRRAARDLERNEQTTPSQYLYRTAHPA